MFFDHYPYTNFHNVNLDWVLQAVKAWGVQVENLGRQFDNLQEAWEAFKDETNQMIEAEIGEFNDAYEIDKAQLEVQYQQFTDYVTNYLNNLDYETVIQSYLQNMVDNGELRILITPTINNAVNTWLNSNITPTSPVIDKTLTISSAGADAQIVGFVREDLWNNDNIINSAFSDTVYKNVTYTINQSYNGTVRGVTFDYTNNIFTITGTTNSSEYSFRNLFGSTSTIPNFINKGAKYKLTFDNNDLNVYMQLSIRKNGVEIYNAHINHSPFTFIVPKDCDGLLLRHYIPVGTNVSCTMSNLVLTRVVNAFIDTTNDATDRTSEIVNILNDCGYCKINSGVFYISNLQMPENSSIIGCGKSSILRLIANNESIYAVATNNNCSISNVAIEGYFQEIEIGNWLNLNRHGIYHVAHYVSPDLTTTKRFVQIDNVSIYRFAGAGIYNEDTGLPTDAGLCVSNCRIYNCNIGIKIPYSGEYNKYNCVDITRCYYGFVNNGSSNVFVGGSISSCYIGIYSLGDGENTPNIGHCVFSGCTFNHFYGSDGTANAGIIIQVTNQISWTFDGCNIAYGDINIVSSQGLIFNACQFGASTEINITDGRLMLFTSNLSRTSSEPVINITNNNMCKFHNNYSRSGVAWSQNT